MLVGIRNRIKCAVNCLRGNPVLFKFTFTKGCIHIAIKDNTYITEKTFLNGSHISLHDCNEVI